MDLTHREFECIIEKLAISLYNCEKVNKELHTELAAQRNNLKLIQGDLDHALKECQWLRKDLEAALERARRIEACDEYMRRLEEHTSPKKKCKCTDGKCACHKEAQHG